MSLLNFDDLGIRDNISWIWMLIEQDEDDETHSPLTSINVFKDGEHFKALSMEENWTLFEVRRHLEFEEESSLEEEFYFIYNEKKVRLFYSLLMYHHFIKGFFYSNINDFLLADW